MAARSIGSGTVSFGLVSIPVRLYAAAESKAAISFNMLHAACKTRLKQQYVCPKDNEIVTRDQMVKGYEFSKDQYVTFTEDEIKALQEESNRAIEITEFVPAQAVDPIYFDGAYYVGPDKGGERAYHLLAEAMRQTGRSALAKWAARGKQYLVLVRAVKGGLVMQQLVYADEVRSFSEVPVGDAEVKDSELKLALQLVEQIASDEFRPESYEDDVRKRYLEAWDQNHKIVPDGSERAYVEAGSTGFEADGVVYYPPELLPGYCALFREAGGLLNFCAYILPGGRCANADLRRMHEHLLRDDPHLRKLSQKRLV